MVAPERKSGESYLFHTTILANPFGFDHIFYTALIRMGRPIRMEKVEEGTMLVSFANREVKGQAISAKDGVDASSAGALVRAIDAADSYNLLSLLEGYERPFREAYPGITKEFRVKKEVLQVCFMRAYDEWQETLRRYPYMRHAGYPTPDEIKMYEALRKKGMTSISASGLQRMLMRIIERSLAERVGQDPFYPYSPA